MKAGALRNLVTIQTRNAGTDAAGQPVTTWTTLLTAYADVRGSTGLGAIRGSREVGTEVDAYSFRIRYREGLDSGLRVVFNGRTFDVIEVRMDYAGREWTDLVCRTGNDG